MTPRELSASAMTTRWAWCASFPRRHASVHCGADDAGPHEHRGADARAARGRPALDRHHARSRTLGRERLVDGHRCARQRQSRNRAAARHPVVKFVQRGDKTVDTRRVTLPFTVASNVYRATLDVRTYGHAASTSSPRRSAPTCRRATCASGGSPFSSTRCARSATGASATSAIWFGSARSRAMPGVAGRHQSVARLAPQRSRVSEPVRADLAAFSQLARHRHRSPARSARSRRAALHRIGERRRRGAARKPFVDYTGVAMVKAPALKLCFAALSGARTEGFASYVAGGR